MKPLLLSVSLLLAPPLFQAPAMDDATYDPLSIASPMAAKRVDLLAKETDTEREVPILVFMPAEPAGPLPIVLFSHGLGGNRTGCIYLGEHWAARGYAVAFMQHPGSDEQIWKDVPKRKRFRAMKKAASMGSLEERTQDVSTTLDALTEWNAQEDHVLYGKLDIEHIGMSGHSFGAVTTMMVSGQKSSLSGAKLKEERLDASIAFSPSPPRIGTPKKGFAEVFLPMMLMTGTRDESIIGGNNLETRTQVYPALPTGHDRYELVLDGAEHSAFTDGKIIGEKTEHNPNHHRVILALSTAFWDANLMGDQAAHAWLESDQPRALMEEGDGWQLAKGK